MDYTGDDFEMPDYGAPNDGFDTQNVPDPDYANNPNLFEMDMDEVYEQLMNQTPSHASDRIRVGSDGQLLGTTLTGDFSDPMDVFGGLDTSMTESYNPPQSNDPSSYPYTPQTNPYLQSVRTQITPQTFTNPTQTATSPIVVRQGNTGPVSDQQSKNHSSTEYLWNPQNWTEMVKTNPYPPGLDPDSAAHGHFGIKGYILPNHIDATFLYHGQGYTKVGEDDATEDLALSDVDERKSQSARPRQNVARPPNTQGLSIPYRTKPSNTQAPPSISQPKPSDLTTGYPWAKPRRTAGTSLSRPTNRPRAQTLGPAAANLDEPIIQPWDILYQRGGHETGIHSANPYSANPSQDNPYQDNPYPANPIQDNPFQLDNDIADNLDSEMWPPIEIPQDTSRSTTSTPTTSTGRPGSRIPVPIRRDSAQADPRRRDPTRADPRRGRAQTTSQIGLNTRPTNKKDPRGRAEPINRVSSNTSLNRNNRRADNQLPPGTYDPLPAPPPSWASTRGKQFVYDISGELQNGTYYTVREIEDFLYQDPRRANMTLWIQRLPADSAARYPYSESRRCRFLHCFMSNGTINQGHYRIAFDELTSTHEYHDPMHNAGYVHLYCFEKYLDFPKIVYDLNVQVDQRILPLEPKRRNGLLYQTNNRMIVSTQGELNIATEFVDYCNQHGQAPAGYPHHSIRNVNPTPGQMGHEGTLVHRLWQMKIRHDHGTITSAQKRGAKASTGVSHMGNLEIEDYERGKTRKRENQVVRKENPKKGGRPRNDPETTVREERAKKRQKLQQERMQLATSLRELQDDDDEDEDAEDYDDEAEADGDRDSLFGD
ncbi:hypothetical protein MMC17_002623 [Xylographa soralifera]|nr:hypothetical protein [Xylographa soralifera]